MRIRKALPEDSAVVADLHRRHIAWGLLSRLGEMVVTAFYRTLIESPHGFVFVAEHDDRVIGFASGVTAWPRIYLRFLLRHAGMAVRVLIGRRHGPSWRRLVETTRYATSPRLPAAELVSIAVEPGVRGSGVAQDLVRRVLDEFGTRGVRALRVTTTGGNVRAGGLYEKMGFSLHGEAEIHPGEHSLIYVRAIEPSSSPGVS